ncbi:MAG: hypothetical protein MRECE_32c002 [Mycoplasmataceae bacterium CE_OT135]|nr:MAG: hypothetical protein MRECE_32c002 [Mycoplasmataceae bacterium CE_OT135]
MAKLAQRSGGELNKGIKTKSFTPQQAQSWRIVGLIPAALGSYFNCAEFAAYLRGKGYQPHQGLNIKQLKEEFDAWKKENKSVQEYLDIIYPLDQRDSVKNLYIASTNFVGSLDCRDFVNLKKLNFFSNQFTNLDLTNCNKLARIYCYTNNLQAIILPKQVEKLTILHMQNNNLAEQDLSIFSKLVNLESLWIGNNNQERISQGVYDRFSGSLEPLQNLTKLKELDINSTDINRGLEYLPESIENFCCSAKWREGAKCQILEQELRKHGEPRYFNFINSLQSWRKANSELVETARLLNNLNLALTGQNISNELTQQALSIVKFELEEKVIELRKGQTAQIIQKETYGLPSSSKNN